MKQGNRILLAGALALGLILTSTVAEGKRVTVTAKISRKCRSQPAKLVVPGGKKASRFRLKRLTNGTKCVVGGKPDNKGYVIKKGSKVVYRHSQWKRKKKKESPVKLGKLVLGPGVYRVYVSGGRGARATISLQIR